MKTKLSILLCALIAIWQCAFAKELTAYDTVRAKLDSIFEYVDKNTVPTGLLRLPPCAIRLIQRYPDRLQLCQPDDVGDALRRPLRLSGALQKFRICRYK